MTIPIIDLHCDLLGCIAMNEEQLHFKSPATNCSLPQLRQGNVQIQTLAIATITRDGSSKLATRQVELYQELLKKYPNEATSIQSPDLQSKNYTSF